MSSLLPISLSPASRHCGLSSLDAGSAHQSSHPASVSTPPRSSTLSLPVPSTAAPGPEATPQRGEGRGGRGEEAKAGERGTRLARASGTTAQDEGQVGRAGRLGWAGVGWGGLGLAAEGSGRRLFSRRRWEATQVSANDLTHCKGGAVERLG